MTTELLSFIIDHEEAFKSRSRLSSLYSDFSQTATTNPDGYHANVTAWKKALTSAGRAGLLPSQGNTNDILSLRTGEELAKALYSKDLGRPLALGAVIHDAIAKKEFIPLKDFLGSTTSIYHKSWAVSPWQVASWALRQIGVLGEAVPSARLATGNFVIVANIEAAATSILSQISKKSPTERLYTPQTFLAEFAHILSPTHALSPTDMQVLLTYLSRDNPTLTRTPTTIKFAAPASPPTPITQQDTTIASLRALIASLTTQIPLLENRITSLASTARTAVASHARTTALAALRSKKLAEATLTRRLDTLTQLETTFASIEAAADNVEIVRVMRDSAGVLRGLNRAVGGAEGVDGVVDALREEMGRVDEVSGIISEGGAEAVDEGEVDEDFEALERAEREMVEVQERAEREKREAEEAERTRVRLAELDALTARKEVEAQAQATATAPMPDEDALAKSIEGMQNMSLGAGSSSGGAEPPHEPSSSADDTNKTQDPAGTKETAATPV